MAGGDLALPAGIQWSDILYISSRVLITAVIVSVLGIALLRLFAARSIGLMITVVVAVSVVCSLSGVGVIAYRMLGSAQARDDVLDLMGIAGLAAVVVSLFVGQRLIRASRAISASVQGVGETGVYVPPQLTLPAELAELSDGLTIAHERLARARNRERALEASRRELVAWVSHDLRTPLAGLRAMAEALEDQVVIDSRTVSQYHSQIRREVNRLTVMIDDLFELSRIHAGALRLSLRMVGLEDLVAEVVASTEPVARARGIRLTGAAVRGMPVYIDSVEMGRALRNLVTNAIRHTPSDGTVDVVADVQGGLACVSVSDACGGIPPEDLPRVFDIAFRGESARTPGPQEGAGLGLTIARGIVEAHSGQIAVRNVGAGCQFLIRLPLAHPGAPALTYAAPHAELGPARRPTGPRHSRTVTAPLRRHRYHLRSWATGRAVGAQAPGRACSSVPSSPCRQFLARATRPRTTSGGSPGVLAMCHSVGSLYSACPRSCDPTLGSPPASIRRHEPGPQPSRFSTMPRVLGETRWPFSSFPSVRSFTPLASAKARLSRMPSSTRRATT
jgi:signal transduction histidine kinase